MILLLGAGADDPAVAAFDGYLTRHAVRHAVCSDLGRLAFALHVDAAGRTRARLTVPGHGTLHGDEVGVFVRDPWALAPTGEDAATGADARFAADEYRAALWALCALLPKVVNRPGPRAWHDDRELRRCLDPSLLLPECWTSDARRLLDRWALCASPELHVEELLTHERRVVKEPAGLGSRDMDMGVGVDVDVDVAVESDAAHLRALFAPSGAYVIELCVGRESFTVLNEPGIDVQAESYRKVVREIAGALRERGVRFFAVALVADDEHRMSVSRIVSAPPYSWYRGVADLVHEQLRAELEEGGR
ncbi:hypothetical protein ACIQWR_13515 [Streptomyces sp. NPDC098789]|uniref:hypothetical protein n=1 Tax=Streptomyces sp. NPDC098789 TaxID=3366098 RepID=UPI00381D2897